MSHQSPLVLDPTGADRHTEYRTLHAGGSATKADILGVTAWTIADPALLKQLLTSADVSKNGREHWADFEQTITTWPLALWIAVENMFTASGGDHRRLRRMVAPAFSHRRIAQLGVTIAQLVTGLIDDLAAETARVVDLRERLAYPVPIAVICHLMGVPDDQQQHFREVVDGVFDTMLTQEQAAANNGRLYQLLDQLIVTKRSTPGDDMTSLLIAARDDEADGRGFSDQELRDTLLLMISAGYETTVNVIEQAILAMLANPGQRDRVLVGEFTWGEVVEETLRLEPAVKYLPLRFAVQDIELPDGQIIPKGDALLAAYGAANRHPDWHGDSADTFDVTRPNKDHLAFGHGVHFCLGAPLARLEVAEVLRQLFERFPHIQLAIPSTRLREVESLISNGHAELPVHLGTPAV